MRTWFHKKIKHSLFLFIFLCFSILPVFGEEIAEKERPSGEKAEPAESQWKLDAGGQVRIRGDFARNQNFTDFAFTPGKKEAQFLERIRLHGSVENTALALKAFFQLQWYGRWGGIDKRSDINLYQGYIEWERILGSLISLKAGRQDFSYGSTFFLGPNDFYNGLSWDGLKATVNLSDRFAMDLLGVKMAKLNPGDPSIYLTGLYTTFKTYQEGTLDGYLFYNKGGFPFLHRELEVTETGQKWFTLGARLAGKINRFDYELEPQFQWGRVKNPIDDGKDKVRAYGGHFDIGYTFKLPWEPRLFGAYALGSGDNDPFDGKVNQFHGNVFNDNYLVGDMSVITDLSGVTVGETHASGIRVLVSGISINPLSNLNLNLDFHRFFASKVPSGFSKDLGAEVNLVASYKLSKGISFLMGLNRFFTSRFFEQAGGSKRNIDYVYIQGQMVF